MHIKSLCLWCFPFFCALLIKAHDSTTIVLGEMKRCFERFDGHKLFGVQPFHSEWRRKSEEHCLEFCVKASSRCASVVFDKTKHICHYFDTKDGSVEPQRKFVYLQIANRHCIDELLVKTKGEVRRDQNVVGESGHQQQKGAAVVSTLNLTGGESISEAAKAIAVSPAEESKGVSARVLLERLEAELAQAAEPLAQTVAVDADIGRDLVPRLSTFRATKRTSDDNKTPDAREIRRSPRVREPFGEQIGDDDGSDRWRGREMGESTKREPEAVVARQQEQAPAEGWLTGGCEPDSHRVWLAVENARIAPASSAGSINLQKGASTPRECTRVCGNLTIGGLPCNAFTFLERDKRCQFAHSDDQLALQPIPNGDFSQRAFRRFCYSTSLSPFDACSEFLAFTDYHLAAQPREVFDGLPAAAEGLSACIELCVLANEFRCMSASFDAAQGICRLFSEHSLSNPNAFREHQQRDQIYFENGCADSAGDIPEDTIQRSNVQRMQETDQQERHRRKRTRGS